MTNSTSVMRLLRTTTGMPALFTFWMLGTSALKSTGTNTIAAGLRTIQSSTRRVCSSMLSGLVGAACSMSAPSSLPALSAPMRTAFQNGLVTFLVNTTILGFA